MNITITGNLGSGKTSVCKELKKAGHTVISAGDIFREIAAEKGMTVIELNEAAKSDRSIDDMLDSRSTLLGKTMNHTVFDSRLAWHFVENSFKVFVLVETTEAARRVFDGSSRSGEEYQNMEEAREGLKTRAKLEQARFMQLYGINYYDSSNYDLIIESSCASPQQLAQEIIRNFELYQKQPFHTKVELNIKCLHPTKKPSDMDAGMLERYRQEEAEENRTLCALHAPSIAMQDGCNYILNGHHRIFAAAAAGKVFAEIGDIRIQEDSQKNPAQEKSRSGYVLDFSKICGLLSD